MAMAAGATREKDLSWLDWSLPVDISRDGNTVLFDEQGEEGGPTYTVAVRDMQGSPPIPLGEGMAGDFSPDGKWVITTVSYTQLMLLPTGAGTIKRIDRDGIQQYRHGIHWMPDGKQILFSGNQAGHPARCFIQNIDGGKPRPITPEGVVGCPVSPDGQLVAAGDLRENEVQVVSVGWRAAARRPWFAARRNVQVDHRPALCLHLSRETAPAKIYRLNILNGQRQFFREINPSDETGICDMSQILFSADGRAYVYGYTRLLSELYLVNGLR